MKIVTCAVALASCVVGPLCAEDTATCPWKQPTGHWRLTDSTGYTGEVVWKLAGDNQAALGEWQHKDGTKTTELGGWRPDKKVFVATGYGAKGSYWEVVFTTVTESMIKGDMINRTSDGRVLKGTWQVTRKSDDEMPTLFVGTEDGKEVTIKGSFTRVK